MLASGILGISVDVFRRVADAGAGAIVSKSLSREPWEGYANPTVFGVGGGGWLNAVGLSNPGAANFARMLEVDPGMPVIISLVGSDESDFSYMIDQFADCNIAAYELNFSCPHVDRVGLEVGDDHDLVRRIVRTAKGSSTVPVVAKVGLGKTDYIKTAEAAIDAGADAITAINTIRAMSIDVETRRPILSNRIGGLSGTPIRTIAVRCVYELSSQYSVPLIGCGGVSAWEDALELILAGASAVQVGSAVGSRWIETFGEINDGIKLYMDRNNFGEISEMIGLAKRS